jgi:hypothetical protein
MKMHQLILLILTLALAIACGRDTRTGIKTGDGGPGRKGDNGLTKLQRIQREALSASVMSLSRFGEIEEILRLAFEDPRPLVGDTGCPEVAMAANSRDSEGRDHLRVEMHWESCAGDWQTLGRRIVRIYRQDANKDAVLGNVDFITLSLKEGRQLWRGPRNQSYEAKGGELLIQKAECDDCSRWTQEYNVFDRSAFVLQRYKKLKSDTWNLFSEQSLSGSFVLLHKDLAPEPLPKTRFIWSEATVINQFVQMKPGQSQLVTDQVRLQLVDSVSETSNCGFLVGKFTLRLKSDRHDEVLNPTARLKSETDFASDLYEAKVIDPFENTYSLRNCTRITNSLPFVKTNVDGLSDYNIREL